jgi:hypothetical protein
MLGKLCNGYRHLIIVERDINSKPLADDLFALGVPRDQIILAYVGEAVPEMAG